MKKFTNKVYRTNSQTETSYIAFEIKKKFDISVIEIDGSKAREFDDYLDILKKKYSSKIDSIKKEDIMSYKNYLLNNEEYESDGYLFIIENAENLLDFEQKDLRDSVFRIFDEICEYWDMDISNKSNSNNLNKCVNVILEDTTIDLFEYHRAREIYIDNIGSHLSIYKNGLLDEYYGYGITSKLEQEWLRSHVDELLKQVKNEEVLNIGDIYMFISRIKNDQAELVYSFLEMICYLIEIEKCYFVKFQLIEYYIKVLKAHRSFIMPNSSRIIYCNKIINIIQDIYQENIYINYENNEISDIEFKRFIKTYNEEKESGSLIKQVKRIQRI